MDSHARLYLYQMMQFLSQVVGPTYHFSYYDAKDIPACRATFSFGEETLQDNISRTELVKRIASGEMDTKENYLPAARQADSPTCSPNALFLRNEDASLVGLLIVSDNYEANTKLLSDIEALLNIHPVESKPPAAAPGADLTPVSLSRLHYLVQELLDELDVGAQENLVPIQKMKIIGELRKRGAFTLKGAVPIVAQLLNTSIPTVYRYLNKLDPHESFDGDIHNETIRLL